MASGEGHQHPGGRADQGAGRHLLGPHVVGTRVVVRRLVRGERGPSGGPAMTDALGTCIAWADGQVTLETDRGRLTIPVADIVSGKPVPPRPSVRHRVPAAEVERHTHVLWPELTTEPLGAWTLRRSPPLDGRQLRRANSVLAMADPGIPLGEASTRARAFYAAYGQQALAHVEPGSAVAAGLHDLGWRDLGQCGLGSGEAHCQLASVARALRSCNTLLRALPRRHNAVEEHVTACYSEEDHRLVVELVDADGASTARGEAALDGDWVGVHRVVVDPAHRRRGLATGVMSELLDWAASRGATTAWLHVETDNPAALALYERLGFRTHHSMGYLVAD